MMSINELT